jgi:hyperosmotically inducible periplasmic protein
MLRALLKLLLVTFVVLAAVAFFIGYRWGTPEQATTSAATNSPAAGTSGSADNRDRAREVGAEIGEKIAAGTDAAERAVQNGRLTTKIKSKLALDDSVRAGAIDVDTNGGVVTLSGTVGSAAERQRAVRLARETDGVTSVVDRLIVR